MYIPGKPIRDKDYLRWIATLPCVICHRGPCDPHHAVASTIAQKASDLTAVPLCIALHHVFGSEAVHHLGRREFARHFDVDLTAVIMRLNREYLLRQIERGATTSGFDLEMNGAGVVT